MRDVIRAVDLRVLSGAGTRAERVDPVAYDLYLRGLEAFNTSTTTGVRSGRVLLRQAADRDPGFSRPRATLAIATAYRQMMPFPIAQEEGDLPVEARDAARAALALDDTSGEAHAAEALVLGLHDWNWEAADRAFARAVALAPNNSLVRMAHARHLGLLGRYEESLNEAHRAVDLDPKSVMAAVEFLWASAYARRFEQVVTNGTRLVKELGNDPMAEILQQLAVDDAAARLGHADDVCARGPDRPICGVALAIAGRPDEARRILDTTCGADPVRYASFDCFEVAARLGNRSPMLGAIEYITGDKAFICAFFGGPSFDVVKDEPRYKAALKKIGIRE